MADVDDAESARREPPYQREQPLGFDRRERGRRLVEQENAGIERDRLGDLDHLPDRDRRARQAAAGRRALMPSSASKRLGIASQPRPVDQPEPRRRAAGKDVLADADRAGQRQLLKDGRDAERLRVPRRVRSTTGRAVEPRSRRHPAATTPERMFISVDLPAPFSPTSACTSPRGELERHVVERERRAEALADARRRRAGQPSPSGAGAPARPACPPRRCRSRRPNRSPSCARCARRARRAPTRASPRDTASSISSCSRKESSVCCGLCARCVRSAAILPTNMP